MCICTSMNNEANSRKQFLEFICFIWPKGETYNNQSSFTCLFYFTIAYHMNTIRYADDSVQKCKIQILWWLVVFIDFFFCAAEMNILIIGMHDFLLRFDSTDKNGLCNTGIACVDSLSDRPWRPSTSQHDNPHRLCGGQRKKLKRMRIGWD